ncbi:MAG: rhodanese-like domain-containing protein [Gammaproteobacteria bacterium]
MEKIPEFIGNHLFLVSLLIAIVILLFWNIFSGAISGIKQLTPLQATQMMNHENALILDVRLQDDFKKGHILNAVNIPEPDLQPRQKELKKYQKQIVITCCSNGTVSTRVARTLKNGDFENIYCLSGGLLAWQNANLPLTREG